MKLWTVVKNRWRLQQCFLVVLCVNLVVQGDSNFWFYEWNLMMRPPSNESLWAVLFWGIVYYPLQGGSLGVRLWEKASDVSIQWSYWEQLLVMRFILLYNTIFKFLATVAITTYIHLVHTTLDRFHNKITTIDFDHVYMNTWKKSYSG